MNTRYPDVPWLDPSHWTNRQNFPPAELARYAGQHVAWSWDGTQIVANGADIEEVYRRLKAAGIDPTRVVLSYVFPPDTAYFG
jgi:hypothetical protein